MGKVVLAHVDARLIHGQTVTSLSRPARAIATPVTDDPTTHDPFTKNIILGTGPRIDLKVRALKEDGTVRYQNDRQYDDYHIILLTEGIEAMADIIRGGVLMKGLNLSGIPQKPGLTSITKEVAINKEQLKILQELEKDYGIDVYFQAIPPSRRASLKEAVRLFEEHSA